MFSQGGTPGYWGGGSFKPKVKYNPKDIAEKFGINALEWLQRKTYGGSWLPEWMQQRLLNQSLKQLEEQYGSGATKSLGFSDIDTKTTIYPDKMNTKEYSMNTLSDSLKWGNEGWLNPLGYVPKVSPIPFRPLRKDETLTGAVKEIGSKGLKGLTAYGGLSWAKEALKSDEVKAEEKAVQSLEEKGIKNAEEWVSPDLPQKTVKNEVLENLTDYKIDTKDFDSYTEQTLPNIISDLKDEKETQINNTEIETGQSNDVENFDTEITSNEAESGNVVDLNKIRKEYNETKDKKVTNNEVNEVVRSPHLDIPNPNAAVYSAGSMELEPDDLSEIKQYIGFLQSIMGDRDPMMQAGLLMQLGTSLMNAKTTQRGFAGFIEAAGQAGAEIAPQLMKLGEMNQRQKEGLATAALQMYMDKVKEARPSGAPYMVAEIDWKRNDAGKLYASGTKPAKMYQLNSDEFRNAMSEDNAYFETYGVPKYYFGSPGDPSTAGIFQASAAGEDPGALPKTTDQSAFQATGGYMNDILDIHIPYLNVMLDNPHLWGTSGTLAEAGLGLGATVQDTMSLLKGEIPTWEQDIGKAFYGLGEEHLDSLGLVSNNSNHSIALGGQSIPVFIDWDNVHGMNDGGATSKSRDMRLVRDETKEGQALAPIRVYMVKDGWGKFFNASVIGQQDLISRTVGIGYARSRQPTGRMLADVLQGSMKDAKFTGIGKDPKANRIAGLSAHVGIVNEMYEKISTAYRNAGITNNPDEANPQSIHYVQGLRYIKEFDGGKVPGTDIHLWNIKGFKDFANKYYAIRSDVPGMQEIPQLTFYTYNQWQEDGEIQLSNEVNKQMNTQKSTVESIKDEFMNNMNYLLGNQ